MTHYIIRYIPVRALHCLRYFHTRGATAVVCRIPQEQVYCYCYTIILFLSSSPRRTAARYKRYPSGDATQFWVRVKRHSPVWRAGGQSPTGASPTTSIELDVLQLDFFRYSTRSFLRAFVTLFYKEPGQQTVGAPGPDVTFRGAHSSLSGYEIDEI